MLDVKLVVVYEEYWNNKLNSLEQKDIEDFCKMQNLNQDQIDELLLLKPDVEFF